MYKNTCIFHCHKMNFNKMIILNRRFLLVSSFFVNGLYISGAFQGDLFGEGPNYRQRESNY
jgi:hypothetical protein